MPIGNSITSFFICFLLKHNIHVSTKTIILSVSRQVSLLIGPPATHDDQGVVKGETGWGWVGGHYRQRISGRRGGVRNGSCSLGRREATDSEAIPQSFH